MKSCTTRVTSALLALAGAASISMAQCEVTTLGTGTYNLDYFGNHMAANGDFLVVGLEGYNLPNASDAGAVRVYSRVAQGWDWSAVQLLTEGASAATNNAFGRAVDIDMQSAGGTIVVGAPMETFSGAMNAGVVRIFQRVAGSWTMTGTIQNPFPATFDQFGYTVAIDGDELFIGCPGDETAGSDKGAVYVYRRVSGVWTLIDTLSSAGLNVGARMGEALDVKGQWAMVGVPRYALAGHTDQGAVLMYHKGANGHWTYSTSWATGKPDGSKAGAAVSIASRWASYSIPGEQLSATSGVGRVCTVANEQNNGSGAWLTGSPYYVEADEASVTGFGSSLVVTEGDDLLIGATGGAYRAFLFGIYNPLIRIPAPAEANTGAGAAVAMAYPTVFMGDPNSTGAGFGYAGRVYQHEYEHFTAGSDECFSGSEIIAFPGYTYAGCTTLASASPAGEVGPVCGYSSASRDVWFKVRTTLNAPVILDTLGSQFDTVMTVHSTCPANGGTIIACDDDSAGNYLSRVVLPAGQPTWLMVRIAGYNGANGAFTLHVSLGCGNADFNGDGDIGTDADIESFFACLAGSCGFGWGSPDFNGDGDYGTDADIEAFFRVLGGGAC